MEDIIKKYQGHIVNTKTQQMLNQPLKDKTGFNKGHEDFLKMLISKLESKELDAHNIQTLHNKEIYSKLDDEAKEETDLTGINILGIIRQIEQLWKLEQKPTFQIQNLVETVFNMKSKFEAKHGDVYII